MPNEDLDIILGEEEETPKESSKIETEEPEEDEEEESESEDEEPKAEKKEEDEEESDDEEDEESKKPILFDRPSIKEIKTKYPDFFKDFPSLRDAYFREREFSTIFPTVEDAKEAFTNNEAYEGLEEAAFSGNPTPLMESLSKSDKKAHDTFALAFLPDLYKRDQETYGAAVTPLFENLVRTLYRSTDENLKNTALNLADYLWGQGSEDVAAGRKTLSRNTRIDEEQEALKRSRDEQTAQKFQQAYNEIDGTLKSQLKTMVLKDFDPNKVFSKLVRSQLANEVVRRVYKQLESDEGHKTVMSARWKRAKLNGYSELEKGKIISTFLARAKTLVPVTREKVSKAALGSKDRNRDVPVKHTVEHPREARGGRPVSNGKIPSPKVDYKKMSDLDILKMD